MLRFHISATCVLLAKLAFAEPAPTAAPYLERGLRLYATQRYAEAIEELKAGYQLDPHPDFLYAIGQAERLRGDCKAATEAYRAYLRTEPPVLESTRAREQIERCEPQLAPSMPGEAFGVPGYAMAGGSVAALGAGALCLIAGKHHASDAGRARTLEEHDSQATTARNYRIVGGVAIAGGVALGTLAVLRFLRTRDGRETKQPAVTASVGSEHLYVGALIQF